MSRESVTFGRVVLQLTAAIVAAMGTHLASSRPLWGLAVWLLGAWMFLRVAPNVRRWLRGGRDVV